MYFGAPSWHTLAVTCSRTGTAREDAQSVRNSVQADANKAAEKERSSNGLDEPDVSNAKRRCVDSFKLVSEFLFSALTSESD